MAGQTTLIAPGFGLSFNPQRAAIVGRGNNVAARKFHPVVVSAIVVVTAPNGDYCPQNVGALLAPPVSPGHRSLHCDKRKCDGGAGDQPGHVIGHAALASLGDEKPAARPDGVNDQLVF